MSESFLRVCDISKDPEYRIADPATNYSFPLDPFQKHAIAAIDQEHNVLVCAKTGSGKTLVGEYQIAHSLRKGGRVFYTTPIKSLSNQKFHDLKQLYPKSGQVGIMTGDIKFCPDAQIIIMTTEILRNLLYKQGSKTEHLGLTSSLSLTNLDAVIFDECHYINDRDRGKVWEETMILLPPSVKLILLSATLDKPEAFAEWLGNLKKIPMHLIQTQYRIVPLHHYVMRRKQTQTIMDAKEIFYDQTYNDWYKDRLTTQKEYEAYQRKVKDARRAGTEGSISGKVAIYSFKHQLNETIESLQEKGLLPALAFVFSRRDCEIYARAIEHDLLDSSDSALADRIFDFHLRHHKQNLETSPQYHLLKRLIIKGIAFHHSGLLPILKEALEILFSKGLVKLLFCTETFAVGINMPTKTVLFLSLYKYDDSLGGKRLLRTDEYIQMAGRAGRRGKDSFGSVIYLPHDEPPTLSEMKIIMKGGKPQIQSRMDFHYDFLFKSLQGSSSPSSSSSSQIQWKDIMNKSFWFVQHQQIIDATKRELNSAIAEETALQISKEIEIELQQKEELERIVAESVNAARKKAQRALDQWKDMHLGPKWFNAEIQWKNWKSSLKRVVQLEKELYGMENYISPIEKYLAAMIHFDYVKVVDSVTNTLELTKKGILGAECNETNPYLLVEIYLSNALADLTPNEIGLFLSTMIHDKDTDNDPSIESMNLSDSLKSVLQKLDTICHDFQKKENELAIYSPNKFWNLSSLWIEPIRDWLAGKDTSEICQIYDIFEGNFVRGVLKLANCLDELTTIATYCEDTNLLSSLQTLKSNLIRGSIIPDSLYLHL